MHHLALFKAQYRPLLIAGLLASCVLTGCASGFEQYYKPEANSYGATGAPPPSTVTPPPSTVTPRPMPVLIQSRYPDIDAKQLAQEGYVLIGTSSFASGQLAAGPLEDSFYKDQAVTQGMKVGAAIVLLQVDYTSVLGDGCCKKVFASYWADAARRRADM